MLPMKDTELSSKNGVEILRKRGMSTNITPSDRRAFVENLEKAMKNWSAYYQK